MQQRHFILIKSAGAERSVNRLCLTANVAGLLLVSVMFAINFLKAVPPVSSWLVLFLFIFETFAAFWYHSQQAIHRFRRN